MFDKYLNFVRGVSVNRVGKLGVVLTTSSFVTFIVFELARLTGVLTNAYLGLITYLLFPTVFIIGLVLTPIGWWQLKRQTHKQTRELLTERFGDTQATGGFFGSRVFVSITIFTLVNILFLSVAGTRMLSFMDEPVFCGTACHSVMNPEWVVYQQSPHARVRCVDCHVGEGADALLNSKLNGMWQMISVTFNLLERPIPTPVRQLRPARETCEKCHWPQKFYGSRLKTIARYDKDETSTPKYTTLNLKIDPGGGASGHSGGIHWHVAPTNEVRYASVDDEREEMIWVEVRRPDGSYHRYVNKRLPDTTQRTVEGRALDCVDCHNRATHIYETSHDAVDTRLHQKSLPRDLPYIKREGLSALQINYRDRDAAMKGIENHLRSFYSQSYPELASSRPGAIDSAVTTLRGIYNRNIHPEMNIRWGTYASHIGHDGGRGCFRCHTQDLVDADQRSIADDCSLCHSILAYGSAEPYQFLLPTDENSPEWPMEQYLRDEFLNYVRE